MAIIAVTHSEPDSGGCMSGQVAPPNFTYFQLFKEMDYPIFLRCALEDFGPDLVVFLKQLQFDQLAKEEAEEVDHILATKPHARILTLKLCTPLVARTVDGVADSDRFGPESIIPKEGYRVYRYKGFSLMIYSFAFKEWEMGCFEDFGTASNQFHYRLILNRFISWALAPLGVVGFWGVPVDEGIVVMRMTTSHGEAVYIDALNRKILSFDGAKNLQVRFKVMRLDPHLKGKNVKMSSEELVSFLSTHCTYFDYSGPSVPIRQSIGTVAQFAEGLLHPQENFKPRTDLSY